MFDLQETQSVQSMLGKWRRGKERESDTKRKVFLMSFNRLFLRQTFNSVIIVHNSFSFVHVKCIFKTSASCLIVVFVMLLLKVVNSRRIHFLFSRSSVTFGISN